MQLKICDDSLRWVVIQLVLVALGVGFILYRALPLPGSKFGGGFFLAIGVLNVLFYRSTGRKFFARTQFSAPFVANFWAHNGEKGTQLLFLGIGILLGVGGCILLVVGSA